jgi:hypothetical protein
MDTLSIIETAERNALRDAGKYAFTAPDADVFTTTWTLTHKTDDSRRYFVETDEAGVPFRCNCPAALRAKDTVGENVCKHQYLLAEHLRIIEGEEAHEMRHEAEYAGRW